jgi:hypothetical protein
VGVEDEEKSNRELQSKVLRQGTVHGLSWSLEDRTKARGEACKRDEGNTVGDHCLPVSRIGL